MGKKVNLTLSADRETVERLKQYAHENHTSVSQAVTDWIWKQKVQGRETNRGEAVIQE